jgi:RNA polymerase sigma factor (sigma-70 family)
MDLSKRYPSASKNLSTRWRCRPGRGLVNAGSTCKTRKRRRDQPPLTPEQQQLAARFLPLARALAKPLKMIFTQWKDEFESAACQALVEAARSFDPSRNIQFATFARFRIRGALADVGRGMGLSGWESDPEDAPGVVTLTPYNEEHGTVLVAVNPPPVGAEFEDIDTVEHWLRKLPKKHASVCRMQYLYGKTQTEIAAVLGCSQAEITRLHKKSLELLSDPYDADGRVNQQAWTRRRARRKPKAGQAEGADTNSSSAVA